MLAGKLSVTVCVPRLVQCLALALLIAVALRPTIAPAPRPPASAADFSIDNALAHVRAIAAKPHPTGSDENERVRAYLLDCLQKLDLNPTVQSGTVRDYYDRQIILHNILARLPAKEPAATSILLVAHHDSVSRGPGAGDDTAAVAALLETMRALRATPGLKCDVQLLLTDGEEMGLLGAQMFCANTSLADIALVLNFDARGTTGPSIMYENAPGNLRLIRHFAAAAPYPIANSLAYDVSRLLPNSSDFRVFRQAGLRGLNFAFIGNYCYYHTKDDTPQHLNPASVYHDGTQALALARHFAALGQSELAAITAGDQDNAIYFNLTRSLLVCYPAAWVWPLTAVLIVATTATVVLAFRRRRVTFGGLASSFARLTLALLVTPAAVYGLMLILHDAPTPGGFTMRLIAILTMSIVITLMLALEFRRRTTLTDLAAAGIILFALLAIPVSLYLPGGSFLFFWPPLFVTLGLLTSLLVPARRWLAVAVSIIAVAPAVLLLAPLIVQLITALTLRLAPACCAGAVLVIWLILAALGPASGSPRANSD
jgi:hypothetical protein